jgi:hypothetical protein
MINIEQLFQYATIKIICNDETGTALLYSPAESVDYIYVLTAKHCLLGKDFDKQYVNTDIILEKIYNPASGVFHSCAITETDRVFCTSSNELDLALIIIPKTRIEVLSGLQYPFQAIDKTGLTRECMIRGFADINDGQEDRPYELMFSETIKDKPDLLVLNFDGSLDTRYQSAVSNVQGLSGSGLFTKIKGNLFLLGIIHTYEEKNRFFATKITTFNYLIPKGYIGFQAIEPEENDEVISAFDLIGINKQAIQLKTHNTVGNVHIPRNITMPKAILENNRMLVLHGKAGVGKSALAKDLIKDLETNPHNSIVTFTAEQLFSPTLNDALIKAGYNATIDQIINSPLSKRKIIFWIESFEKLVEAGFGGAFTELLLLVKSNGRLALLVTIRDYFLQKFKIFHHTELPLFNVYHPVGEFNDEEIHQITAQIPEIKPLLSNPKLSHLLRVPYYLDKAYRIYPQLLNVEDLDEIEFKKLMWEQIVEGGNNRQRGITFASIALKRAMAMELYTFHEPDSTTDSLVSDDLLQVEQGELRNRFSPAHDILEDWALIRYIKQQKQEAETSKAFLEQLDNGPAIRRAFRLWLIDFYKQQPLEADDFSSEVLLSSGIEQLWKDELIIYILQSDNAYPLFDSLKEHLLENKGSQFLHFIHLLRTCCKIIKNDAIDFDNHVPLGSGWDALIDFVYENKVEILAIPEMQSSILQVIFDWSKQLPEFNPLSLPSSARSVALLLLDFIVKNQSFFTTYRRNRSYGDGPKSLGVFLKLASVVKDEVEKLLNAVVALPSVSDEIWTNKNVLIYTRNFVIGGVISDQVSKYFPDIVLKLASEKWIEKQKEYTPGSIMSLIVPSYGPDYWGIEENYEYEASSAYQTFFYWMFLYHPDKAISYLYGFLNSAFLKNQLGRPRGGDQWENIKLYFEGHGEKEYYGSYEYWTLYRGHNAYNKVIQSLLMALEKGLLDMAGDEIDKFEKVRRLIKELLLNSNNVAVVAVISSVIQAFPNLLDTITVVLLGSRSILQWDSSRYATDFLTVDYYGENPFFRNERSRSNKLKHRLAYRRGLIGFVIDYMFFYQIVNKQIFEQIDSMWAVVPITDKMWKKALTEMDIRKYKIEPVDIPGYENHVAFIPAYEQEIAEVIESFQHEKIPDIGFLWASKVFDGDVVDDNSYSAWKSGYDYLKESDSGFDFTASPGKMACLGLRDYFEQLEESEKLWCRNEIIKMAEKLLKSKSDYLEMEVNFFDKKAVLFGVPLLFRLSPEIINETETRSLIFQLIISGIDRDTKKHLLYSISENLWKTRPHFALNCWNGLLAYIQKSKDENQKNESLRFTGRPLSREDRSSVMTEWEAELAKEVISDTLFNSKVEFRLDHATFWFLDDALRMIPVDTEMERLKFFISDILTMHINYLGNLKEYDGNDFWQSREVFKTFYAKYLLSRSDTDAERLFLDVLNITLLDDKEINTAKITEFIRDIIKHLVFEINNWRSDTQPIKKFWILWSKLKDWMISVNRGYLVTLFLLDVGLSDQVDDWNVLKGKKQLYKEFILSYGHIAINESIDLLSGIGFKTFMPDSVSWLANVLKHETGDIVKISKVEKFVYRSFFRYGNQIKGNKMLTKDFLFILDYLIDKGSSKAYMLKEEMIQYK